MKMALILSVALAVVAGLVGCGNSTAEKAIENGKLALADNDIEKAESSFNLAITEDKDNEEAKDWLELIEKYNQLVSQIENKEIDKANKSLKELKENEKFTSIKVMTKEQENTLNKLEETIQDLDKQITELVQSYNPEDENSMPDETYLGKSDELLANPSLTEEQKTKVETFKKDATDRVNAILAREEEKQRIAEQEQQKAAQEKAAQEKDKEIIDKQRAEEILVETVDVDRSIAGVRSDEAMDEVREGVTYYFFDIYALTEGFAADAYYVNSQDGTVIHSSEFFN
ncbi:hypothetical protein CJ195_11255 [Bacillus sp. UMB0899]|uniref:hypothetical protein n=1 Tax=Metabacillus schmidteae TaxID=2730405 RepID=UPI000C802C22|nr:hypothetical protein [Metabacillus schmidteae]PMC37333.1 hypothetical protein CJ195_11255 [Bacillus sp. UMB0899]